jgi:hypothetical protein
VTGKLDLVLDKAIVLEKGYYVFQGERLYWNGTKFKGATYELYPSDGTFPTSSRICIGLIDLSPNWFSDTYYTWYPYTLEVTAGSDTFEVNYIPEEDINLGARSITVKNVITETLTTSTAHIGDTTNYTEFDSTGHQTMVGTAQPCL